MFLAGFTKEQIRVSTEGKNVIRVRGERLAGSKWSRFLEDFQVPGDGEMTSVRARFGEGKLNIAVPKKNADKPQENGQKGSENDDPGKKQGRAESEGTSISAVPHVGSERADGLIKKTEKVIKEDKKDRKVKSRVGDASTIERYKNAVKGLTELNEERQLMVNIGVGVLVVVAISAYVTYRFASREDKR